MMHESDPFEPVTTTCDSTEQFFGELDEGNDRWAEHKWIYRGQNDASWELVPSLFRDERKHHIYFAEIGMIHDFVNNANSVNLALPTSISDHYRRVALPKVITERGVADAVGDWQVYDFTDPVFAIAQHAGVPTRLLDFSYDPFVAAYFAAETTGLYEKLRLSPEWKRAYFDQMLSDYGNGHDARTILDAYERHMSSVEAELPETVVVWAIRLDRMLNDTTLRMLDHSYIDILNLQAQKGVFLWDSNRYDVYHEPWRAFTSEIEKLVPSGAIAKITLPWRCLECLQNLLAAKGYFPANMTPSYERTGYNVRANTEITLNRLMREGPYG